MKNETEEVEVMQVGQVFHLATKNPRYALHETRKIPKWLWDLYTDIQPQAIDLQRRIERYFRPVKDKPMRVSKYQEDEKPDF